MLSLQFDYTSKDKRLQTEAFMEVEMKRETLTMSNRSISDSRQIVQSGRRLSTQLA